MLRRIFIYLLFACFWHSAFTQQELRITTDKAFYSSGEKMGIVVSNTSETESEIIYLEILDNHSNILYHVSTKSDGRIASAVFDIPLDWKSNWYIIRAYSIWVPSIEIKDIGHKALAIYSEFDETNSKQASSPSPTELTETSLQIQPHKESYQTRDEVQVKVKDSNVKQAATWVVSVLDKKAFTQKNTQASLGTKIETQVPKRLADIGEPQKKLLYLGKLQSFGNNGLAAIYIAEEKGFNWLSLNEEQTFGIELDDFLGVKNAEVLSIQAIGGISHLEPLMYYPSFSLEKKEYQLGDLLYTPEIVSYLEAARKRRMIADIYNRTSAEGTLAKQQQISFVKPDKSYAPEDFIRFSDTEDFINEVATFMKLRKADNNKFTVQVMMERNVLAEYQPAMFLNGFMLTDFQEILDLDLDQISRMDVYRKERTILKQFKTLGRNGVVAIYTKDSRIRPKSGNKIQLAGFQENNTKIEVELAPDMPNFSPRLYWNSSLIPDEHGEVSFSFKLGDDIGEYVILIESYTEGASTRASRSIFVKGKTE